MSFILQKWEDTSITNLTNGDAKMSPPYLTKFPLESPLAHALLTYLKKVGNAISREH